MTEIMSATHHVSPSGMTHVCILRGPLDPSSVFKNRHAAHIMLNIVYPFEHQSGWREDVPTFTS